MDGTILAESNVLLVASVQWHDSHLGPITKERNPWALFLQYVCLLN